MLCLLVVKSLMLCFIVNTDLTITTEKLVELFATQLLIISLDEDLDLPHAKIVELDGKYRSPFQKRDACLGIYATGHPCPSWRQIAKALHRVHLPHQADTVENTYVQGTRIIVSRVRPSHSTMFSSKTTT